MTTRHLRPLPALNHLFAGTWTAKYSRSTAHFGPSSPGSCAGESPDMKPRTGDSFYSVRVERILQESPGIPQIRKRCTQAKA